MEYFVISAKFVPLKYYTLSSQLRRLTSFSVGLFGSANSVTRSYPVMRKSCICHYVSYLNKNGQQVLICGICTYKNFSTNFPGPDSRFAKRGGRVTKLRENWLIWPQNRLNLHDLVVKRGSRAESAHTWIRPWFSLLYQFWKNKNTQTISFGLSTLFRSGPISGIASPLCQEGKSERIFPIFALFFPIFPDFFPLFPIFPLFFPNYPPPFPDFWQSFHCHVGTLTPCSPHWLCN